MCTLQEINAVSDDEAGLSMQTEQSTPANAEEHIKSIMSALHNDVADMHRDQLELILRQYSDILSVDDYDLGLTDLI